MVCSSTYTPTWRPQLNAADANGGSNCTAYVTGFAIDYATCGAQKPTGKVIRSKSDEPRPESASPGLNLEQVRRVASDDYDVDLDVRRGIPFNDVIDLINDGRYCILQVSYAPIRLTKFSGSPTFAGGHAIGVPPGFEAQDPLADGRRAGIYKYHGEKYDLTMLRNAAGSLVIGTHAGRPYTVRDKYGSGYAWAAFTVAHDVAVAKPPVGPPTTYGSNEMMQAWGVTSPRRMSLKAGQPLYRENSTKSPLATKMSKAGAVPHVGYAGNSMAAVIVGTGAPYADKQTRPTIVYVPSSAGEIK